LTAVYSEHSWFEHFNLDYVMWLLIAVIMVSNLFSFGSDLAFVAYFGALNICLDLHSVCYIKCSVCTECMKEPVLAM